MARKRKPSGRLNRGPFTAEDIRIALRLDRWELEGQTRPGKVQVDDKWTGVKIGSMPWKGLLEQTGYSKAELLALLNGTPVA